MQPLNLDPSLNRAGWPRRPRLVRVGLLLLLSLALHALLLGALPSLPRWVMPSSTPLEATIALAPPKPVPPPAPPAAVEHAMPAKAQAKAPASPPASPPLPPPAPTVITSLAADAGAALGDAQASTDSAPAGAPATAPGAAPASASVAPPAAARAPAAAAPIDAVLRYDVVALDPKQPNQSLIGTGVLSFRNEDGVYHAQLSASVTLLFFSRDVLATESDGVVGADGLEPEHYEESQRNKPALSTNIARDDNGNPLSITYGDSTTAVAAPAGVQDHLSVLLQVGGLMRAEPKLRSAGMSFAVPVAGSKGAVEPWTFVVEGQEMVPLASGLSPSWHLKRQLRPGSNDRGIEIWVSLENSGLPIRVRYTEPSGATIDFHLAQQSAPPQ